MNNPLLVESKGNIVIFFGSLLLLSSSGWWFQTFFMFHNIWDVILPIDELIFFKMAKTTNQLLLLFGSFSKSKSVEDFAGYFLHGYRCLGRKLRFTSSERQNSAASKSFFRSHLSPKFWEDIQNQKQSPVCVGNNSFEPFNDG